MRTPYIAGNWKMHKTVSEAVDLVRGLVRSLEGATKKVMIAPPFTALAAVKPCLEGSHLLLGAQNMGPEEKGAHTGEVSVLMLEDVGVDVVILGHSERRHVYGEDDRLVNRKVRLALARRLEVILCVGEKLEQRDSGTTMQVIERQVRGGLDSVEASQLGLLTIAYEPVWAIGTGKTATARDADEVHKSIRSLLGQMYGEEAGQRLVIQYGGSVKPENAGELMAMPNVDGLLVGGASLSLDSFVPIVHYEGRR
jgi:triosephosphate isomerase